VPLGWAVLAEWLRTFLGFLQQAQAHTFIRWQLVPLYIVTKRPVHVQLEQVARYTSKYCTVLVQKNTKTYTPRRLPPAAAVHRRPRPRHHRTVLHPVVAACAAVPSTALGLGVYVLVFFFCYTSTVPSCTRRFVTMYSSSSRQRIKVWLGLAESPKRIEAIQLSQTSPVALAAVIILVPFVPFRSVGSASCRIRQRNVFNF